MDYLYYTSIIICINFLIAGIYFFGLKKGNYSANKLFGVILLLNVYVNFLTLMDSFGKYSSNASNLLFTYSPVQFIIPPLLFFYFKTLSKEKIRITKTDILHFAPSIIILIYSCFYYLLPAKHSQIRTMLYPENLKLHYLFTIAFYIQFTAYLFIIISKIYKNPDMLKNKEVSIPVFPKQKPGYKKIIAFIFISSFAAVLIKPQNIVFAPLFNSIPYYLILFIILFKPEHLMNIQTNHPSENDKKSPVKSIKEKEEKKLIEKVINLITIEKIYLDNNISLNGLADKIQVPYYQLSRFINHRYNQNFNDFINSMRIEEAKKKLLDTNYSRLTIEAIGQSVGFNSKSSFYIAFKKYAHCSPKEYMKLNSKNQGSWLYNGTF